MSTWLMRPIPLPNVAAVFGIGGGTDQNLLTPQPKEVWSFYIAGAWTLRLTIDLGQDMPIDTVGALFHNGPTGGFWACHGRTTAQGGFGAIPAGESDAALTFNLEAWRAEPSIPASRFHAIHTFSSATAVRFIRLIFYWPGPADINPFNLGVIALGKRFQPGGTLGGLDWGAGRRVGDLSTVRVLPGGERGIWKGAKVPEIRGSFSHLTDSELLDLWGILTSVGESDPLLLVEAPDTLGSTGAHERIHYGTLTGLDFFERRQTDKSRIELRLQHWL